MDYRSNKAWQACDDLAVAVYRATETYPSQERYGLVSQMRRAAVSAAANIAEGCGRTTGAQQAQAARTLQSPINHWERQLKAGRIRLDRPQPPAPRLVAALGQMCYNLDPNGESMNKDIPEQENAENDDMRSEYDFTGGVRGKHYKALREGHTVKVYQSDGTTLVQHFELQEGTVVLAPDVREYFPDSEAVNTALRCLIPLIADRREAESQAR